MKTLITEASLQARISEMALEIDSYYQSQNWYLTTQEPVVVIGILTGAMFFMADLVRKLSIRTELDFIRTSTYPKKTIVAQEPKIITMPIMNLLATHVLLVDDIFDTGKTIDMVENELRWCWPRTIRKAVLFRKLGKAVSDITMARLKDKVDFVGFDIPDEFVVGYGSDYNGRYREMPYVAVWSEDEY